MKHCFLAITQQPIVRFQCVRGSSFSQNFGNRTNSGVTQNVFLFSYCNLGFGEWRFSYRLRHICFFFHGNADNDVQTSSNQILSFELSLENLNR